MYCFTFLTMQDSFEMWYVNMRSIFYLHIRTNTLNYEHCILMNASIFIKDTKNVQFTSLQSLNVILIHFIFRLMLSNS